MQSYIARQIATQSIKFSASVSNGRDSYKQEKNCLEILFKLENFDLVKKKRLKMKKKMEVGVQ